jgi:putative phage-type endonuclease
MDKAARDLRRQGIGGTDIAGILGLNPYRTVHDVWLEKVGYTDETDDPPSEAAYWGQQLEAILCDEYARREQVCLIRVPAPYGLVRSATDHWMQGSPDRLVDGSPLVGVDAKMAGLRQAGRFGEEGTDQIPEEYLLQCQWYLRLLQAVRWDLAVLLGQQFRIYKIEPHQELQDALLDIARKFWFDHVLTKSPPAVDHTAGARRLLQMVYPIQQDEIRPATEEEVLLAHDLRTATRELERFATVQAKLRNLLCNHIGLAEGIAGPGFRFTWKRTKDSQVTDWENACKAFARMLIQNAGYSQEDIDKIIRSLYTETRSGTRRFRATFYDDKEEAGSDA